MADIHFPGPETIYRRVLPNGLTILAYENFASESVVIEGLVRAGALGESADKAGLAAFTTALLDRGTQQRSFAQIYEALESVGADIYFSCDKHTTDFGASSLVEDVDLVLALLAESLREPSFPAQQVEQVRGQTLTSLVMRANDTGRMARLAFYDLLYPNHPYGRSVTGYPETVQAITREEIARFHRDYFGPQGMILTIVGHIEAEKAVEKVTAVFGDWHNPQQKPLPVVPPAPRPAGLVRAFVPMPDKAQADLLLGLPGPLRSAPDYLDASLMNTVLGVFGMMGRIGYSVREEQGLAYYAYSRLQGSLGPSPWFAGAGVAPEDVEQAITAIRHEIGRMQDELVPADELADSQAFRIGSLPVSLETNSGLAGVIGDLELHDLGLDYLQRFPDLIRAVTPERVQAAARKYLSTEQLAIAVAGSQFEG
ncbi:MAG: insulinase family protein [Ardenticatenaceae bacterium]|nr:insulinase family protein [Ardenticatenaceae bacterium]MCB8987423.1 insulinase family protein [Ardenticatenaceae bacterium]